MNLVAWVARWEPPECIRGLVLAALFTRTATAFGQATPALHRLTARQTLDAYAAFTARAAEAAPDVAAVELRLFATGKRAGVWLRRLFAIRSMPEAMAAAQLCYRMLDIDFKGSAGGEVCITRCFFSDVYSPATCAVMSALDAGLLAGLTDGRRLVFSQRLTERHTCCRARVLA